MQTELHNPLTPAERLEAERLRAEYFTTERASISVSFPREDGERIRRFFAARGTTAQKALSKILARMLETGVIPFEEDESHEL